MVMATRRQPRAGSHDAKFTSLDDALCRETKALCASDRMLAFLDQCRIERHRASHHEREFASHFGGGLACSLHRGGYEAHFRKVLDIEVGAAKPLSRLASKRSMLAVLIVTSRRLALGVFSSRTS
jgi:hypothetical protein